MALFKSNEDASVQQKIVRPTVVRTQNVAKELASIAKSYDLKTDALEFNILEVQTYKRMCDGVKETEWESIDADKLYELDDKTELLNPLFEIKQTYEIEVFSITKDTRVACKGLKLAVGANASKCKIYISIGAGSTLEYSSTLEENLLKTINKRKIRAGILIGIFDEMLSDVVSKISSKARVETKIEYKQAETILIAEGFEPTVTQNDDLILHYEKKDKTVDENEQVDYSSRGFIKSVKKDDLLIEYVKPKFGTPGRNCRGQFMEPSEPTVSHEVTFNVNDTISVTETDDATEYRANENGYIVFEDNAYQIKTDMDVKEISFKTTGSINSGIDSDVSISVKELDPEKDAIGTGMSVEVTEIDIDGNVGSKAKVVARKASVSGQVHASAFIKADKLDINVHRGKARGKKIHITRLEHGTVEGDYVSITQAQGGTIKAKDIDIEICSSHITAIATRHIEIHKLQGSENRFIIDPVLKRDAKDGLDENQGAIDELEKSLKEIDKEIKKYTKLIKNSTASFNDIKKRLIHYKKSGVKMPASFLAKYKQFTSSQDHLKEIQNEFNVKQNKLALYMQKTASFQDNILDARIINRDRWVGYNEIIFRLIEPPIELMYKPAEGSKDKIFGLVEVDDGVFKLEAIKE